MLMFRTGMIRWASDEVVCRVMNLPELFPMLDVPIGKCWEVEITRERHEHTGQVNETSIILVVDKDVDVEKHVR